MSVVMQCQLPIASLDTRGAALEEVGTLYATGAYSYREIAEYFSVHLATVGRIVRTAMQ